ncbi:curli production assembly/transport component CsgF [Phaeodactylibacter xiamenensis]|uniref:curli production assembly/transport component CsgF n=1 Tax=Phaeodactylibacter xiamenensis TaxID=1524460 RepID=UPI003BAAFD99
MKPFSFLVMFSLILLAGQSSLHAQDFTYQPKNPAFGGNYLNYSWMLNSANVQNGLTDPALENNADRRSPANSRSSLDNFTETLNRQLLSQISRQLVTSQFGEFGLEEGTYNLGDFEITVVPGLDGLNVTIIDFANGGQTQITVPYF